MCLAADAEGKVYTSTNLESPAAAEPGALAFTCEPTNVQQVFVVTEASFDQDATGTNGALKKLALKTSAGGYLTADKLGGLNAKPMAMGPQQTFTATRLASGLWALQTAWDKYLTIEKDDSTLSGYTARADAEDVGNAQTFVVRIQAKYKREAQAQAQAGARFNDRYISSAELEKRAGGPLTRDQIKVLKKAYKGTFHSIKFFLLLFNYMLTG